MQIQSQSEPQVIVKNGRKGTRISTSTMNTQSDTFAIIADDGKELFSFKLTRDVLEITVNDVVRHGKSILDDRLVVVPIKPNCIRVMRRVGIRKIKSLKQ